MEEILTNQGLCHIVENISSYLDPKSLAQCRVVCQSWKDSIDNDRQWLIFQLEHIHKQEKIFIDFLSKDNSEVKASIEARFPEWYHFFKAVTRRQNIPELKEFLKHMWIYFRNDSMSYYRTPLHDAAAASNIVFAQLLIDSGIDLEMKNPDGWTPLHFACRYGRIEMVQLLIKYMPAFHAASKTNNGWTIFHLAAVNSDPQVLKMILNTFRFEDIRDHVRWTMLLYAVRFGAKETIRFVIESRHNLGINVEVTDNQGSTILHLACRHRDIEIVDLVHNALEDINSDIDFDTRSDLQDTPLHEAVSNASSDVAIHLIQRFPNKINVRGQQDRPLLHYACYYKNMGFLEHIFRNPDYDIDYNAVDEEGLTGLHHACIDGHFEVVNFLLQNSNEKGIDIFKKSNYLQTAEFCAIHLGHVDILELLEIWTLPKKIEEAKARRKTIILLTLALLGIFAFIFVLIMLYWLYFGI